MSRPVRSCRTRQKDTQPPTNEDGAVTTLPVETPSGKKRARRARGHNDDEDDPPAAASRSKVKNPRKGKLSWLQDMPLDLLLEVCPWAGPCRRLPRLLTLMCRSSRSSIPMISFDCLALQKLYEVFSWRALHALPGFRRLLGFRTFRRALKISPSTLGLASYLMEYVT
jgi:hypothetical protein